MQEISTSTSVITTLLMQHQTH